MKSQQAGNTARRRQACSKWDGRRDELVWLHDDQAWSQSAIADYYGVTQRTVGNQLRRMGIKTHGKGNLGKRNGRYKDGSQSRLYRLVIEKDRCARCGRTERLCVHHKNNNHYDNRLDNLQVLCHSCHMSVTKKAWWSAKRAGKTLPKSNAPVGWFRG